jgi:hypothetical protein
MMAGIFDLSKWYMNELGLLLQLAWAEHLVWPERSIASSV